MSKTLRALSTLWLLAIGAISLSAGAASAAALIKTQSPCDSGNGSCFNFGVGIAGVGNFDIRTFAFTAPSKGNAAVSFNGSLVCGATTTAGNKVVDLITQITNSTAAASASQPGGLRQATVLAPNTSQTLNLASTRVIAFNSAGTQTFRFRVKPLRIDAGTNCFIYNAAFTVVFIP
jgi:hypothetical protein